MHLRGQTTTFQTRLEISQHAAAGLNDTQIAERVGCSVWTVRKWRRRSQKRGRIGFTSQMGRPVTGPVSTFPDELRDAILCLRQLHPGWGPATLLTERKHRSFLARSATAESSTYSSAAQTSRPDTSLSTPSRLAPTTSCVTEHSPSRMADGRSGDHASRRDGQGQFDQHCRCRLQDTRLRSVAIGRAYAFPLLQTGRAIFTASGFPYSLL